MYIVFTYFYTFLLLPVLLQWGGGKGLLGANVGSSVVILNEQVMNVHFNEMVSTQPESHSQVNHTCSQQYYLCLLTCFNRTAE